MSGASFTAMIATVAVCVSQRFGVPESHTCTSSTQLAGGTGPVAVNVTVPVGETAPPHVWPAPSVQSAAGPSTSERVALYVYGTSSIAVAAGVLSIDGASFTAFTVTSTVAVETSPSVSVSVYVKLSVPLKFAAGV